MNILLVSATLFEVRPFADRLSPAGAGDEQLSHYRLKGHSIDLLIPGVGMLVTAYHMGRRLSQVHYDAAINAGIAGSFRPDLPIGEVVEVTEDCVTELGAEGNNSMVSVFELGLMDPDAWPYRKGRLVNELPLRGNAPDNLRKVTGSTVNTIRGSAEGARRAREYSSAGVETMEGAAFLYSCLSARVPSIQIRSISNFVEERDKARWNVKLALQNLNRVLEEVVTELLTF